MKYVRVSIYKGKINIGEYTDDHGVLQDPGLEFQLYDEQGREVHGEFFGEVAWSENEGRTFITPNKGHETHVFMYEIAEKPTPESVEYQKGWLHAAKMKRKVWPKDKSERFVDGYRDAWINRERAKARKNPSNESLVGWFWPQ